MCILCRYGGAAEKIQCLDADFTGPVSSNALAGNQSGVNAYQADATFGQGSLAAAQGGELSGTLPMGQSPVSDTVPGTTSTSSTISAGMSVRGYINSGGDQDWYRIELVAGQQYTFALNGFGRGAIQDPFLRVANASGTIVASDDDSGPLLGSRLTFTPTTSGTYFVSAGGYDNSATGQYLLTAAAGSNPYAPVVSLNDIADYLTHSYAEVNGGRDYHWADTSITFNVTALEPERAVLARTAFSLWSDVTGLTFTETSGSAQITFDDNQSGAFANYSGANGIITSASINVEASWFGGNDAIDSYTFQTFVHEIGHALGLGHAGPYNGSATYGTDNVYANDSWQYSVMSYMDQSDFGGASYRFTMTPMMADILAVSNLYGSASTRTGHTVYGFGSTAGGIYDFSQYSQAPALTIYDSGGTDTLNASGYSANQIIDLGAGNFSSIGGLSNNVSIYLTTVIENGVGGSGNDTIRGNNAANLLDGGGGNDTLEGGGGNDQLRGAAGADLLYGGVGADTFIFYSASEGGDTIGDFNPDDDTIALQRIGFGLSSTGTLADAGVNFVQGSNPTNGSPTIMYDQLTGWVIWDADGTGNGLRSTLATVYSSPPSTNVDRSWSVCNVGDYNGNGSDDILWRSQSGELLTWIMQDNAKASGSGLGSVDNVWQLGGSADFDGDGHEDLLWRNATSGETVIWKMVGGQKVNGYALGNIDSSWRIATIGDFTGDGKADIVWQNENSFEALIWQMNGPTKVNGYLLGEIDRSWNLAAVGDFNNDGFDDLLWRNQNSGEVLIWKMANGQKVNGYALGSVDNSWKVVSTTDTNADNTDDIVWHNVQSGQVVSWTMFNLNKVNGRLTTQVDVSWQVAGSGDFNNNDIGDLLWRHTDGSVAVSPFDAWNTAQLTAQDFAIV